MSNKHPVAVALEWMWRGMGKPKPIRRMLTHEDFNVLVNGGEVKRDGVTIALADIGFHEMLLSIHRAAAEPTAHQIRSRTDLI